MPSDDPQFNSLGPGLRVLLAEERERDRQALQLALELRGYVVESASDGQMALDAFARQPAELVIIGGLPGGSAATLQLCAAIRGLPDERGAQAIILVGADPEQPESIVAALDAGASNYLRLPLDVAQLRGRLEQAELLAGGWRAADAGLEDLRARLEQAEVLAGGWRAADANIEDLRSREARYRALVEHALDVIAILAVDGTIQYASPAIERILGYTAATLVGSNSFTLVHTDDAGDVLGLLTAALNSPGMTEPVEAHLLRRDGGWTIVELRATNLQHIEAVGGIVLYARDITARKQFEEQLERRALYDPLTTLPNRTLFMDYLEHALARADRRLEAIVVLFTDLDNFKMINDSFGHAFGDQLLTRVAERLRACLRSSDTAARLGGDEFTVLLEDVGAPRDAVIVAERIIRELSSPFFIDGHEVFVSISVGIAASTPGESRPGDLLRESDVALYRAKADGKGRWAMYSAELDGLGATAARLTPPPAPRARRAPEAQTAPAPPTTPAPAPTPTPASAPEPATPPVQDESQTHTAETLQLLLARIAELEHEASRLEARVRQSHMRHEQDDE
jgi:diguanylate cyclase (GGDEF)-like protein/PAS domain S-box-containing protein